MKDFSSTILDVLDSWLKNKCNGIWEHQHGITLESTDNPGWWLFVHEQFEQNFFVKKKRLIKDKYHDQVEVTQVDGKINIYGRELKQVLGACAVLLENESLLSDKKQND